MKEEIEDRLKFEETVSRISSRFQADLLQKTFNSMTDAVFVLDAEFPPTILECNEAASAIFGYKKSEMLGKTTAFLHVNDENLREYQSLLYSTIREGKTNLFLPEYGMRRKDGSIFPTEHTVAQLLNEEGHQIGWVNIVKDLTEKKNIKEALRRIEEGILTFAEKAKDMMYRISMEKGFEYVNQASKAITGYTPEELYANPFLIYRSVHPEDLPKLQKLLEDLSEHHKPQPLEIRFFHKEGHLIVTEQINVPIYDETGKLVAIEGILRDITERKRMEEELLESEERFKNIFNESPSGIVLYDSNIRVINANKACLDILGVSDVAKIKGLKFLKDPNMPSEVKKSLLRGESVIYDVSYNFDKVKELKSYETKKSGIAYLHGVHTPIMRGKRLTGYLVQIQDITERKRIEEAKRTHASILETLVHSTNMNTGLEETVKIIKDYTHCSSVGIRILDEQGNIHYEAYTGFPTEFYKSESRLCIKDEKCMCFNIVKGDYGTKPFYTENGSFYSTGITKLRATVSGEGKGEVSPVCSHFGYESISVIPIRLGGRILGFIHLADERENMVPLETVQFLESIASSVAVSTEKAMITAQLKEAEEKLKEHSERLEELVEERTKELRKAQERLLRAERLAAIGEFAAMVGHDLRNPLTGIAGVAYILKKKLSPEKDEKIKEMLEVIEKNVKYSNRIVSELLEYSREIQLELTKTNPKQVLKDTLTYIKVPINIRLLDLTMDEPKIMVDMQKIRRVFENIIQNSIDAMPEGGELTIKSREANGNLEIAFTDNGIGISNENMEKLFKPLFTTKATGIGLGLPICKRIVEAHGGSVSIKSVEGKGTTLTITLPINQKNKEVEKYE